MSKGALDEFLNRKPRASRAAGENADSESEEQEETNYRAYGANRTGRQVLMLDVRTLTGERLALSYSYLNSIFFDASGILVLSFGSHNIRIKGRNLAPVYEGLLNHAVRYVRQENPEIERDAPESETFISLIEIDDA
jgi:hypothetical protein